MLAATSATTHQGGSPVNQPTPLRTGVLESIGARLQTGSPTVGISLKSSRFSRRRGGDLHLLTGLVPGKPIRERVLPAVERLIEREALSREVAVDLIQWAIEGKIEDILLVVSKLGESPFQRFSCDLRENLKDLPNFFGAARLFAAVKAGDPARFKLLAELYTDEELEHSMYQNRSSLLDVACQHKGMILALEGVLGRLSTEMLGQVLNPCESSIHYLFSCVGYDEQFEELCTLLKGWDPKWRIRILSRHLVNLVPIGSNVAKVEMGLSLLEGTTPEMRAPLLKPGNDGWRTPFHTAVGAGSGVLRAVLKTFTVEELAPLLKSEEVHRSPLVLAANAPSREEREARLDLLKPLMDSLTPEEKREALMLNKLPGGVLGGVVQTGGGFEVLMELFTDEEFQEALEIPEDEDSLFHRVTCARSVKNLAAVLQRMSAASREKILRRHWKRLNPLIMAGDELLPQLLTLVTDEELECLMKPLKNGETPLHKLVSSRFFQELVDRLPPALLAESMVADDEGHSPIHRIAREGDSGKLSALTAKLSMEVISGAMLPNRCGNTPLRLSISCPKMYNCTKEMIALTLECGGAPLQHAIQAHPEDGTLFHLALSNSRMRYDDLTDLVEFYRKAGVDPKIAAMEEGPSGELPLALAIQKRDNLSVAFLFGVIGKENVARCLRPNAQGAVPLFPYIEPHKFAYQDFAGLVKALDDPWDMAVALGHPEGNGHANHAKVLIHRDYFIAHLERTAAEKQCPDIRQTPLIMNELYYGYTGQSMRDSAQRSRWSAVRWGKIQQALKSLDAILPNIEELEACLRLTENSAEKEELQQQITRLRKKQHLIEKALVLTGGDSIALAPYEPLFARMLKMADDKMYHEFCKLMARFPLSREQGNAAITPWLEEARGSRKPCLFLLVVNALELRGMPLELCAAVKDRFLALPTSYSDRGKEGLQLLRGLVQLVQNDDLSTEQLLRTLEELLRGDFAKGCIALGQILDMRGTRELKDALSKGQVDFAALSKECFQKLVPMRERGDFSEQYQKLFGSQRRPDALITYASRISSETETRAELGEWVDSVMDGRFLGERYSEQQNPHLNMVYERAPHLRQALPKLFQETVPVKVGQFTSSGQGLRLPLGEQELREKILDDRHLDHARFPEIVAFLEGDPKKRRRIQKSLSANKMGIVNTLRKLTDVERRKDLEICKLEQRLQMLLCKLSSLKDPKQLVPALRSAVQIAGELRQRGRGLGEFENDLVAALDRASSTAVSSVDDFEVSVTDHYWDLLLLGSDVKDSCQRVDGYAHLNRCLLSYVMDGKNIPLVVRRPGSDSIVARRLLRIELDSSGCPVLFLERLYSNYSHQAIDTALTEMAKQVANTLGLSLYTSGGYTRLQAETGRNTWTYSDAARGTQYGGYKVCTAQLIHRPKQPQAVAASSRCSGYD